MERQNRERDYAGWETVEKEVSVDVLRHGNERSILRGRYGRAGIRL
jgi:hypothetical protein